MIVGTLTEIIDKEVYTTAQGVFLLWLEPLEDYILSLLIIIFCVIFHLYYKTDILHYTYSLY
jgi:hypothetical protein